MTDTEQEEEPVSQPEQEPAAAEEEQDKIKPVIYIGLVLLALFSLGCYDVFFRADPNRCSMTYMFELPQYIDISLPAEVNASFPKYRMVVYGEGEGKHITRLRKQKLTGVPVLFIPGNAGSYKQVRSLASVALRKAIDDTDYHQHFDFFSVDFGEELSGLYGGTLEQQTQFVCHCIRRILALYTKQQAPPTSVVLVGHSMGGLLAKAVFTQPELLPGPAAVRVIISLAAPHSPALLLDSHIESFYQGLSQVKLPEEVSVVSVGGGARDWQVRSGLAADPSAADLAVVTEAVPGVWASTDHQCIVWCKQLVLAITRALFDLVEPASGQVSEDLVYRSAVLRHHLKEPRVTSKQYREREVGAAVVVDRDGYWADILKRQFTVEKGEVTCEQYSSWRVEEAGSSSPHTKMTVEAVGLAGEDWLLGCRKAGTNRNTQVCLEAVSLADKAELLPGRGKRRTATLDLPWLAQQGYSHVLVHTARGSKHSLVHFDNWEPRERELSYTVPKWINFWRPLTVLEKTASGAVYYNVSLGGLEQVWQAYTVTARPTQCAAPTNAHYGLARLVTPWSGEVVYTLLGRQGDNTTTNSLLARMMTARPPNNTELQFVELWLDPACRYSITVQPSLPAIMGQMVRFFSPMLLSCSAAVAILVLAFQLRRIDTDLFCRSTLFTLATVVSPINVVLPSRLLAYLLGYVSVQTDIRSLQEAGLDFGVLPIMMFFTSLACVLLLSCGLWVAVLLGGSIAHRAVLAWATRLAPHEVLAEVAVSSLARLPALLASVLLAVALSTCGALALCLGCLAFLLKLFQLYQDYLQSMVKRAVGLRDQDDPSLLLAVHFQTSLAVLWLLGTLLHLPTLLTWLQYPALGIPADPSLPHAICMSACLAVLWQNDGRPRVQRKFHAYLAIILHGAAIFIATFATVSLYRVSWAVSASFLAVALHQLVSPDRDPLTKEEEEVEEESELGEVAEVAVDAADSDSGEQRSGDDKLQVSEDLHNSESEYEYEYKLKLVKRKVKQTGQETDSCVTDTGLGTDDEQETSEAADNVLEELH